jgi:hypothetical protein
MSSATAFTADRVHLPEHRRESTGSTAADSVSTSPRRTLEWTAFWAVAIPLGLLDGLHWYLRTPRSPAAVVVLHVLVDWTLYPALVPLVRFVTRKNGLDSAAWPRHVPVHLVAALGFQYVHLQITQFMFVMVVRPLFLEGAGAARYYFPGLPPQHLREYPIDLLAYWIIVGFCYASHYRSVLHQREIASARLETCLAEARLELLRRQLSPHFLFNTLNTISVLAQSGEQTAFLETLACLSELLRVALDETQPQTVVLSDELRFLDGYLRIQQIRFADRLTVRLNVEDASLNGLVPFMILQPLVENAIEHGIRAESSASLITIEAAVKQSSLRLRVCDGGPGFANTPGPRRHRIGLANTESRLQQLYGEAHKIEYGHAPNGGASVTISIPFQQPELAG